MEALTLTDTQGLGKASYLPLDSALRHFAEAKHVGPEQVPQTGRGFESRHLHLRYLLLAGFLMLVAGAYTMPMETDCLLCTPTFGGPWLGTDPLGRDILVRLLRGVALSGLIGVGAAGISLLLGTLIGTLMGSRPGTLDRVLSIILQAIWVVPALLWASLLAFIGGRHLGTLLLAIALSTWTETARLIRVEVRRLWHMPFIEAGRAIGLPYYLLLRRHILRMLIPLLRVQFLQAFATAILIEAGLGFVGLSLSAPHSSLGTLLFEAIGWLTLPQGQLQGILAAVLLGGMVFAVYSQTGYGRRAF